LPAGVLFHPGMLVRSNTTFVVGFIAIGLFAFLQPCTADENLATLLPSGDNDEVENADDDEKKNVSRISKSAERVTADGMLLPNAEEPRSLAVTTETETAHVESVVVTGSFDVNPVEYPALPEVEGTKINSGKKTSFVRPEEFPAVTNNDYREATATTPGLLVSEEPSSPIINFGYRGLDSQRAEFMQVLKDGVSIKNEQFGFPETHYTPILDAVERIEFIRGGAALQYGPQPGGALNFVMKMPRRDGPFHFVEKNTFGSDELYTNFTAIDGSWDTLGYYAYYDHRERAGFRQANSDYHVNAGSARLVWDVASDARFILTVDIYEEEHGEPGGLRRKGDPLGNPPKSRFYEDDRNATTRFFDRFRLKRDWAVLDFQKLFSERTQLDLKAFGGYLSRYSKRQRGGDEGSLPTGGAASSDSIQEREDWIEGGEARLRHDYELLGDMSTFAGGVYIYHAMQDRTDERGDTPDADHGMLRNFNVGEILNASIFAENRFHFGRLSLTPGMRLEFFEQRLDEIVNVAKATASPPTPLASRNDTTLVPLFGVGTSYVLIPGEQFTATGSVAGGKAAEGKETKNVVAPTVAHVGPPRLELYGNFSQAYRPITYGELVPTSATGTVNSNLEEGHSLQYELGLRGKPLSYLNFDMSGFLYTLDDQIAEIGTTTQNAGDARYIGFEAAAELDVLTLINGGAQSPWGRLNLYGNITWLDAEFTSGPTDGNTPAYAPDYQFKTGAIYRWKESVKVGLLGTLVDTHFSNADNGFQHFIPAYNVWDLTAEVKFWNGRVGVFAGIKNLFDEDFWAEVRDEGIVPASRRNYYAGVEFFF
jgi:Fe(3+) dicitrate transport protein